MCYFYSPQLPPLKYAVGKKSRLSNNNNNHSINNNNNPSSNGDGVGCKLAHSASQELSELERFRDVYREERQFSASPHAHLFLEVCQSLTTHRLCDTSVVDLPACLPACLLACLCTYLPAYMLLYVCCLTSLSICLYVLFFHETMEVYLYYNNLLSLNRTWLSLAPVDHILRVLQCLRILLRDSSYQKHFYSLDGIKSLVDYFQRVTEEYLYNTGAPRTTDILQEMTS